MTYIRKIGGNEYKYRSKRVDGKVVTEYLGPATFWDKFKKYKDKIGSVALTLFITYLLMISGPVSAVTLGITDIANSADEGTETSFLAKVDLHTNDLLSEDVNFTVTMENTDGETNYTCTFDLNGDNLTECANVNINSLHARLETSQYGYGYGYLYGYGYDFNTGNYSTSSTNFTGAKGYGYAYSSGYGYDSFSSNLYSGSNANTSELIYNITWTTPDVSSDTNYTIGFTALITDDGTKKVRYEAKGDYTKTIKINAEDEGDGGDEDEGDGDSVPPQYDASLSLGDIGSGSSTDLDIPDFDFTGIAITASEDISNGYIDMDLLDDQPGGVDTPPNTVYNYYDFSTNIQDDDMEDGTLEFRVPVSWYNNNNLDPETTTLLRWHDGEWQEIDTTLTDSDDDYYYFEASVPGFSYFTVTSQTETLECPECPEPSTWSECIEGSQTRTNYRCGEETDYECEAYNETKSCVVPACNNGVCEANECTTCPQDCTVNDCCGNDVCDKEVGENYKNCPQDCAKKEGIPLSWKIGVITVIIIVIFLLIRYIQYKK